MPARLVEVTLINNSSYPVHWQDDYCEWGDWQDPWWPSKLKNVQHGQRGSFRQENQDWFSGCEGWAYFRVDVPRTVNPTTEYIKLSWDRPFFNHLVRVPEHFKTDPQLPDVVRLVDRGIRPMAGGKSLGEIALDLLPTVALPSMISEAYSNYIAWFVEVVDGGEQARGTTLSALSADQPFELVTYLTATQERVWEALIRPELAVTYWRDARIESPWSVGSRVNVIPLHAEDPVESGTVLEVVPNRRLSFTLKPQMCDDCEDTRITFALAPVGQTTKLTLSHDRLPKVRHPWKLHDGWRSMLAGLKTTVENPDAMGTRITE